MSTELNKNGERTETTISKVLNDVNRMISGLDIDLINKAAKLIAESDIVISFGNGGSYAVASHLVGDLMLKPGPLAMSIGDNSVSYSAYANDYSFEEAAALALERVVLRHPDLNKTVIVFSTSGESKNIMRIAKTAKENGCTVIAVFGRHLHRIEPYADIIISVDGTRAGRIEVVHDAICHAIAEIVPGLV